MRGTQGAKVGRFAVVGIIPAHAGNTVSYGGIVGFLLGSSPRMRGTHAWA